VTAWPESVRRVVVVAPRVPEASGGAVVAETYAEMFAAAGLEVEVISIHPGTRGASFTPTVVMRREELHRGPVLRGGHGPWGRVRGLGLLAFKRVDRALLMRRYRRRMASYGRETLMVFTHVTGLSLLRETGFEWSTDRPLLVGQYHSPYASVDEDPELRAGLLREYATVDVVAALSAADAASFAEVLPVPCVAMPNPTSLDDADTTAGAKEPLAVALARYSKEKQLDLMIRAFAEATAPEELRHWRLELYGWGPEREVLEAAILASGATERITLMGAVDDVRPVLGRASVNLLTSRLEGFGMSVLEAAQCGVPSIAFGCTPGLVELLTAVHGRMVLPPDDEAAYVDALRECLGDEPALAERGVRAAQGVTAYSREAALDRWASLVGDLVGARHS
jgi:glycosyltransferase involved in cell wall biosynthesis